MDCYQSVAKFHEIFDPVAKNAPHALTTSEALKRAHFIQEELVEYVWASGESENFDVLCEALKQSIDLAQQKVKAKEHPHSAVVQQSDALLDLLYFIYGTFVKMNVDPNPLFAIVHQANMGKVFPDGKPHYDAVTHKVLKPDDWEEKFAPEERLQAEIDRQTEEFLND